MSGRQIRVKEPSNTRTWKDAAEIIGLIGKTGKIIGVSADDDGKVCGYAVDFGGYPVYFLLPDEVDLYMNIEGWNTGSTAPKEPLCAHIKQFFNTLVELDITIEATDAKIKVRCDKCRNETTRRDSLP